MVVIPTVQAQIIVTVIGSQLKVNQVIAGTITGVETQPLHNSQGDLTGALAVIQNAIFQNK